MEEAHFFMAPEWARVELKNEEHIVETECNKQEATPSQLPSPLAKANDTSKLPSPSEPDSFWTKCNHCNVECEYKTIFMNHNLRCMHCKNPFYAVKIDPPTGNQQTVSVPIGNKFAVRGRKRAPKIQIIEKSCEEESQSQGASKGKGVVGLASNLKLSSGKGKKPLKTSLTEVNYVTSREVHSQLETGDGSVMSQNQGRSLGTERVRVSRTVRNSGKGLSRFENRNLLVKRSRMEIWEKLEMGKRKDGNANAAAGY
ncbi:hypothetical protein Vadar_028191 [Vaccinium darrowii]|uniref:Uncharacterized protein n=1 Tax=Vaccinium darrowii TaxID=229202 RepID=A0ACB7YYY6_9ERIC|nr:hypothetical protein Vadar_028191 [Vaccinium darrowii]